MILIFSLDAVLLFFAALMFIGVGWATMIAAWLWEHALIIGIILLILYVIYAIGSAAIAAEDYSLLGIICAVAHAIVPPFVVVAAYQSAIATGEPFELSMLVNFMLVFWGLNVSEVLWLKAIPSRGGTSRVRLIFFTILSIAVSALLLRLVVVEGF